MKTFTWMLSGALLSLTGMSTASVLPPIYSTDISAMYTNTATAGFSKASNSYGSFGNLDYNPLFLVAYKSFMFMEASVDFQYDSNDNTQTSLDNLNVNMFLHDNAIFGIGKFDSAMGKFVADLSPAWINRLPTAPLGFDAEQAAPQSEVGMQLRGGLPVFADTKANYILYVANGPRAFVDLTNSIIDHISTDGFTDSQANFITGGRLGYFPIPALELGVSATFGKLALINLADGVTVLEQGRQYNAFGADASYKCHGLSLRGEYIQQQVASNEDAIVPQSAKWQAWYLQAAYLFSQYSFEPVLRYGQYNLPSSDLDQKQLALGLNYWFTPSMAAQVAYHINGGQDNPDLSSVQLVLNF